MRMEKLGADENVELMIWNCQNVSDPKSFKQTKKKFTIPLCGDVLKKNVHFKIKNKNVHERWGSSFNPSLNLSCHVRPDVS